MDEVRRAIEELKDSDRFVRNDAAKRLGELRDASAVPALVEALGDEDLWVRWEAAGALLKIGDASAVPALMKSLGDEDAEVRWNVVQALGGVGKPAVPALVKVIGDGDAGKRRRAGEVLISIIDKAVSVKDLQEIEDILKEDRGSLSCKERKTEVMMEVAKLLRRISEKKNELADKKNILLDDKPKPPKGGKIYRSMRRACNG